MDEQVRQSITRHLDNTVDIVLERVRDKARLFFNSEIISSGNGTASPFSKILFPQVKLASLLERSFSASIGTAFNYIARDLVRATFGNGELEYVLQGALPVAVIGRIDSIIDRYRGLAHSSPSTAIEIEAIRDTYRRVSPDDLTEQRRVKSDLFFVDDAGLENYLEIKTPMPNYDTCKAVKTRILIIHALRYPDAISARVGFPHNPNGARGTYAWPPSRYFLDPEVDWAADGVPLMGEGLWNYLGGSPNTFQDILGCCEDVFSGRGSDVLDVLNAVAFGAEEI